MPVVSLTEFTVKNLKPPQAGFQMYFDHSLKGFGVRITSAGSKSYIVNYGPEKRRIRKTIGSTELLTLKHAREKARNILRLKHEPEGITFDKALDLFLTHHCKPKNKPSTAMETERLLIRHFARLGSQSVATIKTADLMQVVDTLASTPSEANHAFTAAKTCFSWLLGRGYVEKNPLQSQKRPAAALSRDRVLSNTELAKVLATARQSGPYGLLLELLILSGQRVGQFAPVFTGELLEDRIVWPAAAMKGNLTHTLPLTPKIAALLTSLPRFNNFSTAHTRFLKKCGLSHFTRHDLRRSFASGWQRLGVRVEVTEAALAHRSGTFAGVTGIYQRYDYFKEVAEALAAWEKHLSGIVGET